MTSPPFPPASPFADDTLLLLNRATVLMHAARTVAHELNNVFQTISGSAELMEMSPAFPESLRKRLAAISGQSSRGQEIVGDISDLARFDPPRRPAADVGRAIQRAMLLRKFEHSRSAIGVTVTLPESPVVAQSDPLDLCVMLLNLVINAEQAIAGCASRAIAVAVDVSEGRCRIAISDNGQTPLPDADPFAPLMTTRPSSAAVGLGLTATRILAARNGGDVQLERRSDGTAVILTVPLALPA